MRSDLRDTSDTISKMIQFGTVKYGIVKQLKDRSRSERDVTSDQEETGSCSPVAECKPISPELRDDLRSDAAMTAAAVAVAATAEDHNHNNTDDHIVTAKPELLMMNETYPGLNECDQHQPPLNHHKRKSPSMSPSTMLRPFPSPKRSHHSEPEDEDEDPDNMSDTEDVHQPMEKEDEDDANLIATTVSATATVPIPSHHHHHLQHHRDEVEDDGIGVEDGGTKNPMTAALENIISATSSNPPATLSQFPNPPMTLEAIQNMQIAIAQFAAKTLANGGADNEAAMKQLAFLQQTLFNLQQQQIFQLQLIQQLQSQLAMNQMKSGHEGDDDDEEEEEEEDDENGHEDHENNHDEDDDDEQEIGDAEDSGADEGHQSQQQNCVENSSSNHRHHHSHHQQQQQPQHHRSSVDFSEGEETAAKDGRSNSSMEISSNDGTTEKGKDAHPRSADPDRASADRTISNAIAGGCQTTTTTTTTSNSRINMPKDISMAIHKQDENTPLPYGSDLASSIITNHDNPPSLNEPNSLEMLQKRAQEVLDSASQGILAGNLADEFAFGKDKSADGKNRNEPFFKHRCRYCGKVFGSDSALQIHIRSHTGERPFKCNVCGSRFTTKGNLKVHFQRHAQKFPHVPMNSTPIPEHLDKFHPPLLEQMSPEASPPHPSQMSHVPNVPVTLPLPFPPGAGFPGLPLYRPPLEILKSLGPYPGPFFGAMPPMPPKREQELPTDLRKPQQQQQTPPAAAATSPKIKEENSGAESKEFERESPRIKEEKRENETDASRSPKSTTPPAPAPPPPLIPQPPVTSSSASSISTASSIRTPPVPEASMATHRSPVVTPQLPPAPVTPSQHHHPMLHLPHPITMIPRELDLADRIPLNFAKTSPDRRSPIRSPVSIPRSPFLGPMRSEMTLLPRPHSNDNSWENFIEVSNTSETMKLKELMKNKKITDPNQCVVCDRVLSCKSALQMHYRTHTGERPFKCRICGRAFTTKGNLKTHMAVHKIRPPMRNFHQCPVCHKKYSNALVLQQHIRLHTGEPTDLTPEQIQAAEIRDFPPTMMPGSFINPFAFNFGMPPGAGGAGSMAIHQNGHIGSESSQGDNEEAMDCSDDFDDEDISDHLSNGGDSDHLRPKSRDDIKGMMLEQKLKIDATNRPKSEASTSSAPTSPVSVSLNKSSPAPSDTSQGALDLTPRSTTSNVLPPTPLHQQQPNPSPMLPNRPPFGMFPNIPLFPPATTQNMCNAMNSIAQSVMPAAPFNPLALSGVRGSTTCGICFKTFPCHSALEIHYRSHTKERPFKCSICDRGFTTKGNLKQHMLTHKIRDMEQDAFRNRAVKYMSNWKEGFE